jgi:hypothetical protein
MTLKEISIRQYISSIDFQRDDWKLSKIEEDMKRFLGEIPGIEVEYKKDVMINESTKKPEEFKKIEKVSIVFYDLDDKFKKIDFLISI